VSDRETLVSWFRERISEWEPVDRNVLILRATPMMPPGYAWHRWLIDSKKVTSAQLEDPDYEDQIPQPQGPDDFERAQRALVLWLLRQLKRRNWIIEKDDGTISLDHSERVRKTRDRATD